MEKSTLYYGSVCVSDIIDWANKQHSAFVKGNNGKIYANINIWLNDTEDKFGNNVSLQLSAIKEKRETEGKCYIGNAKKSTFQEPQPISSKDAGGLSINSDKIATRQVNSDIPQTDADNLPF